MKLIHGELTPQMPLGRTLAKADIERIERWIRDLRPEETVKIRQ